MKKLLVFLVCGVVALAVVAVLAINSIARKSLEVGVKQVTGFPLEVGSLSVGLASHRIEARDVRLKNPPDFQEPLFADVPQIAVDYDPQSLFAGQRLLNELLVDIKQLVIAKDKDGQSNVARLKGVLRSQPRGQPLPYKIAKFRLKVGSVTIKETVMSKPVERTVPLQIDATYHDVTNATDLNRLVLLAVLGKIGFAGFGLSLADLKEGLTGNLLGAAGETLKGVLDLGAAGGATNLLQKAGGLLDKFKKP
jgi:uncharacterized protein involved in outer membrane biogenesis